MNFTILRFDTIGSTNAEALAQARRGAAEGVCVVADRQTAGRGRHGRVWISEKGAGLYFSIVLRPTLEARFLPLITLMTAVAVAETLSELYSLKTDIKWANDVLVGEKKICGILAEMTETDTGRAVIVGIGINLKASNFPPEIAQIATSIEEETGKRPDREELLQTLTRVFERFYDILQAGDGAQKTIAEWTRRSSYAFGKQVRVKLEGGSFFGTTDGLDESGSLRVKTETGETRIVRAGDVENLRKAV